MRGETAAADEARDTSIEGRSRRWRIVRAVLLVTAVLLLAMTVWVGVRAALAASALVVIDGAVDVGEDADEDASEDAEGGSSWAAATALLPQLPSLAAEADRAASLVGDPVWMLAEGIPVVGANLEALRVVATEADELLGGVALPLVEAVDLERGGLMSGERVDLEVVDRLALQVADAADRVQRSLVRLHGLGAAGAAGVLPVTADAAASLTDATETAARVLEPARALAARASSLLGKDGEKHYLAMFLTPAELRASGGLPGAAAAFTADAGAIARGDIYSTRDYSPAPAQPVVQLTDTELELYGNRPARLIQDTTATEDFTRAALFAGALTQVHHGFTPEAVVAVDVVALSYLLEVTGPVPLATGELLDAGNASALLMNEVYLRYPEPHDQDAFFADVAARVFDSTLGGDLDLDPVAALGALARATEEGRILAWSADEAVQTALDTLAASAETAPARADLGVYLNDRTSAKMDFYLEPEADVVWAVCDEAVRLDRVTVSLANTVDPSIVAGLPWYITGGGLKVPEGTISTQIIAVGPRGATVREAGGNAPDTVVVGEDGRPRVAWVVDLVPGESGERAVLFSSPQAEGRSPRIDVTPAVTTSVNESGGALADSCRSGG